MKALGGALAAAATIWLGASEAHAYQFGTTKDGDIIRWLDSGIQVEMDLARAPEAVGATISEGEVVAGFSSWSTLLPEPMVMAYGTVDGDDADEGKSYDGRNVIRWVVDEDDDDLVREALATTFLTYRLDDGGIVDADIVINAVNYDWTAEPGDDCAGVYDLQNVIAHEAGHFFGMGHSDEDGDATMYPRAGTCETKKRDLGGDDVAGITFLYQGVTFQRAEPPIELGCAEASVGRSRAIDAGMLLVFGFILLSLAPRRAHRTVSRRGRWLGLVLAAGLLGGGTAEATTLRHVSVEAMAQKASAVVRGKVVSQSSRIRSGRIVTDSIVAVNECWRGDCDGTVTVTQLGGTYGDVATRVEGIAPLSVGDEVVLFLVALRDGVHTPVGMAQGAFRVTERTEAVRDLRGLRLVQSGRAAADGGLESQKIADLKARVLSIK